MTNNYLDRSNYVKGLLLLMGKDKKISDDERDILHNVAETLSFDKKFIDGVINELFENKFLGDEPPLFSQKQYAEAFLRDAIQLALIDNDLSNAEFDWLQSIAVSNDLSDAWLNNEIEYYLSGKYTRGSRELQIENIFDTV